MKDVTKEMFVAWKNDPVTVAVIDALHQKRELVKESIANAAYDNHDKLQQVIGYTIGLGEFSRIELSEENENDATSSLESLG